MKKELKNSFIEGKRYGNEDQNENDNKVEKCEDTVSLIRVYEEINETKKKKNIYALLAHKILFLISLKRKRTLFEW